MKYIKFKDRQYPWIYGVMEVHSAHQHLMIGRRIRIIEGRPHVVYSKLDIYSHDIEEIDEIQFKLMIGD